MNQLSLTSPAFEHNGWMPVRYTGYGEDISPELHIDGVDSRTVSMVITLDDLDHPVKLNYNHWVAWNLSPVSVLPEALPAGAVIDQPLHMQQGVGFGRHVYRGPKPPLKWKHQYLFTLYTLDTVLDLSPEADRLQVTQAMEGHILQQTGLMVKYQKGHKE